VILTSAEPEASKGKTLHLIPDRYGTHKHPAVSSLAGETPSVPSALHADQFLLAQLGGAMVS
jgi:hypothetical protein